jgi:hypothetical protein
MEGVGNAGCPLHPRSRVHLVVVERTRVTTSTPESPGIPARNGFNGLCRALPGDRALLPPSLADFRCVRARLGRHNIRELDASVGASGPHDFAVRNNISRQRAVDRSQVFRPAPRSHRAQNAAASTASRSYVRDDRDTPLCVGRDGGSCRCDLGGVETGIFLQRGLDTSVNKPPDGQITTRRRAQSSLVSRTRCSALYAAPQSRDPQQSERHDGPRISSAPRRKCGALRCIRGTTGAPLKV